MVEARVESWTRIGNIWGIGVGSERKEKAWETAKYITARSRTEFEKVMNNRREKTNDRKQWREIWEAM